MIKIPETAKYSLWEIIIKQFTSYVCLKLFNTNYTDYIHLYIVYNLIYTYTLLKGIKSILVPSTIVKKGIPV